MPLSQGPPPVIRDYLAESKAKYPLPDYPQEDDYEDAVRYEAACNQYKVEKLQVLDDWEEWREQKKEFGERDVAFKQQNVVLLVVGQPSRSNGEGLLICFLPLRNLMVVSVPFAPLFPLWPGLLLFLWYLLGRLPFGDHLYCKSGTVCSPGGVGGIMISYLTHLDMEYWGMECCGMSGATTSHNWAGFYVKNDITFIFISMLEEEIWKMPDICLHLITPSLFHAAR